MVGTRYYGVAPRKFNGTLYHYRKTYKTKKVAEATANMIRLDGGIARVEKVSYGYNLYVAHRKRRHGTKKSRRR